MTIQQNDIGQLLMCGFDGLEPTDGILDLIKNHNLGSIIFFSRNIASAEQVQKLTHDLQQAAKDAGHVRPLFIAVDQENGVVRRLGESGTYLPGNMAVGAMNSVTSARQIALTTSKELLALGMNWNLAPDMDVNNNALNPVIGVRSYGENPELVGRLGLAQVEGYQQGGVATSIKHFPGHGDTATDSHLGIPVIDKSLDELDQVELVPFKKAIQANGLAQPASVMIGHMALPQLFKKDETTGLGVTSSLSPEIANGLLRKRLHYRGVIITDCLEMDAVKESVGSAKGAVLALQAGNDMAMISHTYEYQKDAFHQLNQALLNGQLDQDAIQASIERVNHLKDQYLSWDDVLTKKPLTTVGCHEHIELSQRLYDHVPTLVRNDANLIPLQLNSTKSDKLLFLAAHVPLTLAIDSEAEPFNAFYHSIQKRYANTEYIIYHQDNIQELVASNKIQEASHVIIGTANANLHPFQVELIEKVYAINKKVIVAAVINPYDLMTFPTVETYIVNYEYTPPAHEATVKLIFGEIESSSQLPVTIPNIQISHPSQSSVAHVELYDEKDDLNQVYDLWKRVFGKDWPIQKQHMQCVLNNPNADPAHFVARHTSTGNIIGFISTMIQHEGEDGDHGQVALIMVHPSYQRQGIGSQLHDQAIQHFIEKGVTQKNKIRLGSTYPRFFCGLPATHQDTPTLNFFNHRGWELNPILKHDLMGDLTNYATSERLSKRMKKENIWFGRLLPKDVWQLYAFLQHYFPYWLSTYQHHIELGDYQDILIGRQDHEQGRILAITIVHTTNITHEKRADLIWTDETLFGKMSGGMACVGVATEDRGRGIGLGIVDYANQVLKQRGVKKAYVDMVELVDFYALLGYSSWRTYNELFC
ncbi:glycoside hydrolase superfamily [Cunninghamella echinulata]|nr:glycoside hydrolase superfamily [Cunninghamella echinulata]